MPRHQPIEHLHLVVKTTQREIDEACEHLRELESKQDAIRKKLQREWNADRYKALRKQYWDLDELMIPHRGRRNSAMERRNRARTQLRRRGVTVSA